MLELFNCLLKIGKAAGAYWMKNKKNSFTPGSTPYIHSKAIIIE